MKRKLWLLTFILPALTSCAVIQEQSSKVAQAEPTYSDILAQAQRHEHILEEGWYFGELSRVFKSPYNDCPPVDKAKFALDLDAFLESKNQDMSRNIESYVPYSQRAKFAEHWWLNSNEKGQFAEQSPKLKVVWIQESLMDGSELWWRAYESKNGSSVDSMHALAHDEEQKRVHEYQDADGKPRSLSDFVY